MRDIQSRKPTKQSDSVRNGKIQGLQDNVAQATKEESRGQ